MTPRGLDEHHQGGLPARCCRARKGRPQHVFAHVLAHRASRLSFQKLMEWGELMAGLRCGNVMTELTSEWEFCWRVALEWEIFHALEEAPAEG